MPITQDRMIAVVMCADAIMTQLIALHDTIVHECINEDAGSLSRIMQQARYCQVKPLDAKIIASELMHLKHCQHRNKRTAAMRRIANGKAREGDEEFVGRKRKYPDFRAKPTPTQHPAYSAFHGRNPQTDNYPKVELPDLDYIEEPSDRPTIVAPKAKSGETDAEYIARRNAEPPARREPTIAPEPPGTNLAAIGYPPTWDDDDGARGG